MKLYVSLGLCVLSVVDEEEFVLKVLMEAVWYDNTGLCLCVRYGG